MTADDKYSLLKKGNLVQDFKMQLSRKRKIFSKYFFIFFYFFFLYFLNLDSMLNIFKQKWPSYYMYFWTYVLPITWLDKRLKSPFSEDPSTSDMVNGPKNVEIWTTAPLPYLLNPVKGVQLEKVSLSDMQNLRTII